MQSFRRLLIEFTAKCIAFDVFGQFAIRERNGQKNDSDKRNEAKKKNEARSLHGKPTFLGRVALDAAPYLAFPINSREFGFKIHAPVSCLSRKPPSREELQNQDDERNHQQEVNQISGYLKAKAQYPEDQENNKSSPKHRIPSWVRRSARPRMPRHPTSRQLSGPPSSEGGFIAPLAMLSR